jgi:hypothetical protein
MWRQISLRWNKEGRVIDQTEMFGSLRERKDRAKALA